MKEGQPTKSFDISDEEFANDEVLKNVTQAIDSEIANDETSIEVSGNKSPISPPYEVATEKKEALPKPKIQSDLDTALSNTKTKIDLAIATAAKAQDPQISLQRTMEELKEDSAMLSLPVAEHQQYQIQSLQFLCNALIRNAKLATKMTRIVNTDQVTKAVNKTMLMKDFNPTPLNLEQFLHHPSAAEVWALANTHNSDFDKDNAAWGQWWMILVQDQNPRLRLRRTLHHIKQFNYLTSVTFTDFGHNPTRYSTEWLVIQLTRLGDHLLASQFRKECGFNWPYEYYKMASLIARNRMVKVVEIFTQLDKLWPAGVRMNFHYSQPAFNDCVLQFEESDELVGKIPIMKKMRHRHDDIFGGPNVATRHDDEVVEDGGEITDDDDDEEHDEDYVQPVSQKPPQPVQGESEPAFPVRKKQKRAPQPPAISDDESEYNPWNPLEPRKTISYADLFH